MAATSMSSLLLSESRLAVVGCTIVMSLAVAAGAELVGAMTPSLPLGETNTSCTVLEVVASGFCIETVQEFETATPLETVTLALLDFLLSAWLVAVTCTVPPDGKSAGAI